MGDFCRNIGWDGLEIAATSSFDAFVGGGLLKITGDRDAAGADADGPDGRGAHGTRGRGGGYVATVESSGRRGLVTCRVSL